MTIHRYTASDKAQWDSFIDASRNGTFLFRRDFMDYHADRFMDHSLICTDEKGWLAVLPANEGNDAEGTPTLWSHQGLTYGGFVLAPRIGTGMVMALFDAVRCYLRQEGFRQWHYKQVPYIYHRQPAEDDEYALWRIGATLETCNIATAIDLRSPLHIPMEERRGRGQRRALKTGYAVRELTDPEHLTDYWSIIEDNLRTAHATRPVHSCAEMQLLMRRFPTAIRCWVAEKEDGTAGGVLVMFETEGVAHSQYPHATEEGKQNGVMDLLMLHAIDYYSKKRPSVRYFDFGISNEQGGRFLNEGLQAQKEGFGAHGVTYRQWLITV